MSQPVGRCGVAAANAACARLAEPAYIPKLAPVRVAAAPLELSVGMGGVPALGGYPGRQPSIQRVVARERPAC